ncbi:hypothetical protein [Acutalibacter caecimuris]|uniref:hypothetical protein n=1 Tax=Acutalibacter caecimuris TaxID=3093657 RepID=UPI002AC9468B|nr:hypothetical protein [Acutalibacter sp. M00118]
MPSFIQFLFQVETWREKYRKKEAVSLTTKFNSASGPVYCLAADCRGRFTFIGGRYFWMKQKLNVKMKMSKKEWVSNYVASIVTYCMLTYCIQ